MKESLQPNSLISTPLKWGGDGDGGDLNRFSGFHLKTEPQAAGKPLMRLKVPCQPLSPR
jgi:hypothetical protein